MKIEVGAMGNHRIFPWNYNGGSFNKQVDELSLLDPDIAIFQEIRPLEHRIGNCCWIPSSVTPYKAVAGVSRNGYQANAWPI